MKKILILENSKAIRNMISGLIENENLELALIASRVDGHSRNPDEIPDLVIADLTSIKKEKVELLMKLKNNPVISLVPFLLIISGNGLGLKDQFAVQNYYLNRPFTKENLVNVIKKIFNHTDSISPW